MGHTAFFDLDARATVFADGVSGKEVRDQLVQSRPVPDDRDRIQTGVVRERAQDLVRRVVGL